MLSDYEPKSEHEEKLKLLIIEYGTVDTIEKAYELDEILKDADPESVFRNRLISKKLIESLGG